MGNNIIKALVIDDSSVIRRLMGIALDRMGLEADFVDNGEKALKRLEQGEYDIIFLDIMMEGMDGYKVCKLIKSKPNTKEIPVIMLTSRDGAIDKIRGKLAGADHYLTKPVKMKEFKDTIEKYVPVDTNSSQNYRATDKRTPSVERRAQVVTKPERVKRTQPVKLRAVPSIKPTPEAVEAKAAKKVPQARFSIRE